MVRLTGAEVSRLVWASSVAVSSAWSMRLVFGSKTRRTGASFVDSSRTASSTASTVAFSCVCSALTLLRPASTFGLVSSSISSSTWRAGAGRQLGDDERHWPRASCSTFQRARTFRPPRPLS